MFIMLRVHLAGDNVGFSAFLALRSADTLNRYTVILNYRSFRPAACTQVPALARR